MHKMNYKKLTYADNTTTNTLHKSINSPSPKRIKLVIKRKNHNKKKLNNLNNQHTNNQHINNVKKFGDDIIKKAQQLGLNTNVLNVYEV